MNKQEVKGFYVLLEKSNLDSFYMSNYDCMGIEFSESKAMEWRNSNIENRAYKYCPNEVLNA